MNKIDVIIVLAEKKNLTEKQATEIVKLKFKGFTKERIDDNRAFCS